ncbi:TRAFAC clade GTPase domain-containing protein [Actinomadura rugatobispora]|uniref:Double-GTPase 2 domain-containing protein n=1 Tax=Actinomadura rugatobispora TaxID=1994 RepID=A0ABW1A997_9ACTN|nr:hypothetical protein GCM10010200_079080 [Actinomadura rugatobispora]
MRTPEIKLTILGATGSGKTTLMLGMYAMLATGVHGYHLFTRDPDDHIDLTRRWDTLYTRGELPPPTDEVPTAYQMIFNHGLETMLHLDFVDFRGGAGTASTRDADTAADIPTLRERLAESNSIYLVLDGHHVGDWIREECAGMQVTGAMGLSIFTQTIMRLFQQFKEEGRARPSLVVIVTKCDVLEERSGMPRQDALRVMVKNLKKLVPFAYYPGVTAMICPVQLGRFGVEPGGTVKPGQVDPIFVHKPLIFSLMHYLTEQAAFDRRDLKEVESRRADARTELEQLRSGFGAGFFRGGEIRRKSGEIEFAAQRAADLQKELDTAQQRAAQLMGELDGLPIIKDGVVR